MVRLIALNLGLHRGESQQMGQQRLPLPDGDPAQTLKHFLGVAGSFDRGKPGK